MKHSTYTYQNPLFLQEATHLTQTRKRIEVFFLNSTCMCSKYFSSLNMKYHANKNAFCSWVGADYAASPHTGWKSAPTWLQHP